MRRLDRALLDLADSGTPRGVDALQHGIDAELGDDVVVGLPSRRELPAPRRRGRVRWIAAAALATLLLVGVPAMLLTMDDDPIVQPPVSTIPSPVTTFLDDPTPSTIGIPTTTTTTAPTTTTLPPRPLALDITWQRIEAPQLENAWMSGITSYENGYVGVGGTIEEHDAAVWLSPDGVTWQLIASDTFGSDQDWFGSDGDQLMNDVAVNDEVVVAVGADEFASEHVQVGAIWYSADGRNWERVPYDATLFGNSDANSCIDSVVAWDGGFVAAGLYEEATDVWVSPDGIAWTRSDDVDLKLFEGFNCVSRRLKIADGRLHLVVGRWDGPESVLLTSDDGLAWDIVTPGPTDGSLVDVVPTPDQGMLGVGNSEPGYFAAAWTLESDADWAPLASAWDDQGGDAIITSSTTSERTLLAWSRPGILWGSVDAESWYVVGEFDGGLQEILDLPNTFRAWGTVVDLLDEGDRIIAVGSTVAWSSTEDIGGLCRTDDGANGRGSCRKDAAIWIGTPAD